MATIRRGHSGAMLLLRCGTADLPAALATAPGADTLDVGAIPSKTEVGEALSRSPHRLVVLGSDAAFGAVMTRLMRTESLDTEVAFVTPDATPATRAYELPLGDAAAELALGGAALPTPLARDESGQAIVGRAVWRGADGGPLEGQVYADSTHVFSGTTPYVELVPTREEPGVRVATAQKHGVLRRRRWFDGRAVQIGTPGILIERDGVRAKRPVKRASMYRHLEPMHLVRPA